MIERLTRAAREAQERRGAGYVAAAEIDWEVSVRAVLEAMREPTPEMIEAGGEVMRSRYGCDFRVSPIWRAMIEAALDGGRDGG